MVPRRSLLGALVATLVAPSTVSAGVKLSAIAHDNGIAIGGYDAVALFPHGVHGAVGELIKGSKEFASRYRGVEFKFASAQHRNMFEDHQYRFILGLGGYCLDGMVHNCVWVADPVYLTFFTNRWYGLRDEKAAARWNQIPEVSKRSSVAAAWRFYEDSVEGASIPPDVQTYIMTG